MKKLGIISLAIVLLIVGSTYAYFRGKRYHIEITQEQIDKALSEKFPKSKDFLFLFTATYSNPQVTLLEESNRVQVGMDVSLDIRLDGESKTLGGGCTVTSGISYNAEEQAFYLSDAEFDRIEIQGIPTAHLEKVTKFAEQYAKEYIESQPVYKIRAKDTKTAAVKMLLKEVEVRDKAVHVTLGL